MTKILIADDILDNRYLLLSIFRGAGFEVEAAENGKEALAMAEKSPPDMIVADILMPVMDGFELCRRWKADEALKNIPFIFYTATYTDPKDEHFALSLGADRFIVKPQTPDNLMREVVEVLDQVQQGRISVSQAPVCEEQEVLRLHNEVLLRKLEKKVMQLEVEAAERERLVAAVEQTAEMVLITDVHGNIQYLNPAFEVVTGYAREEVLNKNPRILKSGKHDESFYGSLWNTIGTGKIWKGRFINRKKDGTLYTDETTISPIRDGSGTITSYVAVKRDITHELNQAAQLLQAQKMESIGLLAGGVAHDFNNILSVILNCVDFVIEKVPETHEAMGDLREISRAGARAAALTRQLLAFSRRQLVQPVPLSLNQIAIGIERMLGRIIGEDIQFVQKLAPDLGTVRADPGQMEQVIVNLVVNARDAMPGGGQLTIETTNVEIDETYAAGRLSVKQGPYVMLSVSDTGSGMDEATKSQLFDPFFTTKEKGKGTGLGLATVYGIIKQSGGHIWVYSEPGEGTVFKIYLPRVLFAIPKVSKTPVVPFQTTGNETLLVVEDEAALRQVIRRSLEAVGYTVLIAANGDEAITISSRFEGEIHLLLTDVVMPGMGGRTLVEQLTKTRSSMSILYMSGYTDDAIIRHGVLDEGTPFIGKPFSAYDLTLKVRQTLDGKQTDTDAADTDPPDTRRN